MENEQQNPRPHSYAAHATAYIATAVTILVLLGVFAVMLQQRIITINGLGSELGGTPQTPMQMLISDSKASASVSNLQVQYKLGIPILGAELSTILGSNNTINMTVDMLNNRTSKAIIDLGSYGAAAIYKINGTQVTCEELSSLSFSSGLTCMPGAESTSYLTTNFSIVNNTKEYNYTQIKFNGTRNFAGDACDEYNIFITPQNLTKILNETSAFSPNGATGSESVLSGFANYLFNNDTIRVSECISKAYGIPDQLAISYFTYSKLLSRNLTTTLLTLNASSISHQSFSPQTFELPLTSSVNLIECTPTKIIVNFTSYQYSANSTVLISNLSYKNYSFYDAYSTTTIPYSESVLHPVPNIQINVGNALQFGKSYNVSGSFANATSIPSDTELYPMVCVAGSCQQKYCFVYQPYNYTSQPYNYSTDVYPLPLTTINPKQASSGTIIYPVNVIYQAGGSWYPGKYNNETDPAATFSNGTGTGGVMSTTDAWDSQDEYSTWDWYFNSSVNGTFYVKWKSSVTPCTGENATAPDAYLYLDAFTPYSSVYSSSSTSSSYNTWDLNATDTALNLTTTKITGKYSAISLEQFSDSYGTDCPLNTTVYGVWAVK